MEPSMNFQPDKLSRRQMDILLLLSDTGQEADELAETLHRAYADPPPSAKIREDLHLLLEGGYLEMEGVDDRRVWNITDAGEEWLTQRREWEDLVKGDSSERLP